MDHIIFPVIETTGRPQGMLPSWSCMKIKVIGTVKPAQTFQLILYGVRMNQVHDHGDTLCMGFIY